MSCRVYQSAEEKKRFSFVGMLHFYILASRKILSRLLSYLCVHMCIFSHTNCLTVLADFPINPDDANIFSVQKHAWCLLYKVAFPVIKFLFIWCFVRECLWICEARYFINTIKIVAPVALFIVPHKNKKSSTFLY